MAHFKLLIINDFIHHKNKFGIEAICKYLHINYIFGTADDIINFDIIYSPSYPIDTNIYDSNKFFIFGPHFSVFPNLQQLSSINNINNNSVYIPHSDLLNFFWFRKF